MIKKYIIKYMIDGELKTAWTWAKNEVRAIRDILQMENISSSYADYSIIEVRLIHNDIDTKVTL